MDAQFKRSDLAEVIRIPLEDLNDARTLTSMRELLANLWPELANRTFVLQHQDARRPPGQLSTIAIDAKLRALLDIEPPTLITIQVEGTLDPFTT
jgi:hypothetical protein